MSGYLNGEALGQRLIHLREDRRQAEMGVERRRLDERAVRAWERVRWKEVEGFRCPRCERPFPSRAKLHNHRSQCPGLAQEEEW